MVIAAHLEQALEAVRFLDGAEFRNVRHAVGREFHAHQVRHGYLVDRRAEEIGPLGDRASDEDAAGAAAHDRDLRGRCVLMRDEPFGAGDRVVPGVRLGQLVAGLVPVLAVFSAAAHMRNREYPAAVEPRQESRPVERRLRNAVGTVAVEDRRVVSVELDALDVHDRQRHERAVLRLDLDFGRDEVGRIVVLALRLQPGVDDFADAGFVGVIAAEARPAPEVEDGPRTPRVGRQPVDIARERQLDPNRLCARCVRHAQQIAHAAVHAPDVERILRRGDAGDDRFAFRHDGPGGRQIRIGERNARDLEARRVLVGEQI